MHDVHDFILALATVLGVAAVTTVLFQRLKQPVVLGYVLAGLIIGPHVPIPLVADPAIVHTLSELGVILLMFSLGLEFSLRKLIRVGPTAGLTAVVQCSLMIWLGFLVGRAFGWTSMEALFTGALIAISSTTIIAKAFDEQGIRGALREVVVGVLIVEDLIAILLMATLTAVSTGSGLSAGSLAVTVGKLVGFLVALVAIGLLVVPRAMRAVVRLGKAETTVVAAVGVCFGIALLAQEAGYSVALGAFIAGMLVAESGEAEKVEHLVQPVRDVFAAIFFVSVGMLLDPRLVLEHWLAVVVLTVTVVLGKLFGVTLGAFLSGSGTRTSVQAAMSLSQIGEFSFIIAGLGLSLGATGSFLYPVAVAVSVITTLITPWLIRASGPAASWVDRKLPHALQTFAALYAAWVERLRAPAAPGERRPSVRRKLQYLLLDAVLLAAVIVGTSRVLPRATAELAQRLELDADLARWLVIAGGAALALPFLFGIVRLSRGLGALLAAGVLPEREPGQLDLAAAPRRALLVTLQLASVLLVGMPVVAIVQPFVRGPGPGLVLAGLLVLLAFGFWRSATNLEGHVRAGAQVVVELLAKQSRAKEHAHGAAVDHAPAAPTVQQAAAELLPGIGAPVPLELAPASPAAGRTLAEVNLRGLTGATVLAIRRGEEAVLVPGPSERLRPGDVLALAGSQAAIDAARALLAPAEAPA